MYYAKLKFNPQRVRRRHYNIRNEHSRIRDLANKKKTLRKHGHAHNKNKERGLHSRPVEITGVILKQDGLFVPNRLNKKLYEARQVFVNGSVGNRPVGLEAEIRGREMQKKQIILANSKLNAASLDTHLSDAL